MNDGEAAYLQNIHSTAYAQMPRYSAFQHCYFPFTVFPPCKVEHGIQIKFRADIE